MSDTAFIHEVGRDTNVRVQLTLDADEIEELRAIAAAAIDASVLVESDIEARTVNNAQAIYDWSDLVLATLEAEPTGLVQRLGEE